MNKLISKTKIETCDHVFNPVWGCDRKPHCPYCYARRIAKRFCGLTFRKEWEYRVEHNLDDIYFKLKKMTPMIEFQPVFLESNFNKEFPKKPQRIFVGSMSEIAYWEKEWIEKVIEKIKEYPQHTFQFLTKFPEAYMKSIGSGWGGDWYFIKNCWLGVTISKNIDITKNDDYWMDFFNEGANKRFISFEPLLENINLDFLESSNIDWVIVGAETGNRKGKVTPKKEWIENIVDYCKGASIPVYLKDSLKEIYPVEIKEFPKIN